LWLLLNLGGRELREGGSPMTVQVMPVLLLFAHTKPNPWNLVREIERLLKVLPRLRFRWPAASLS
jgi:hypothetical protein